MKDVELVIFIGLQGSGKSSFYRGFFAGTHDWVSKDRFPNRHNSARRQRQLIEESLWAGRSVVVDNTNATWQDRADLIDQGHSLGARILGYYFSSCLADCLERNQQRTGKARVPDVALYVTLAKLERPELAEGFDWLFFVRLLGDSRFEVVAWRDEPTDPEPDDASPCRDRP